MPRHQGRKSISLRLHQKSLILYILVYVRDNCGVTCGNKSGLVPTQVPVHFWARRTYLIPSSIPLKRDKCCVICGNQNGLAPAQVLVRFRAGRTAFSSKKLMYSLLPGTDQMPIYGADYKAIIPTFIRCVCKNLQSMLKGV